jgi:hypothetical protein
LTKTTAERFRRIGAAAACALFGAAFAAAAPSPEAPGGRPVEYESSQALFGRVGASLEPVAATRERWQYSDQEPYKDLTLGFYERVERHLKLGAFYRLQYGARHDDDWKNDSPGHWSWRDTTRRPESVAILDATPRTELPFLPGGGWVGSLKLRGERDFFNGQDSLLVAPELAWFWLDGLRPRATFFLRFEAYVPLNWGETKVYERWWYLAALWHAAPWLSLGPSITLRDETWSTSAQFLQKNPGADYKVLYRSWVTGFTLVARLR